MNRSHWTDTERAEFETLCTEAWESSKDQQERTTHFLAGLLDAVQAHRDWASDELASIQHRGAASSLKSWRKAQSSAVVMHDGREYVKPRVIGIRSRTDSGIVSYQQTLFDFVDVDDLQTALHDTDRSIDSQQARHHLLASLIHMCEQANVRTPHEAEQVLGISCDEWIESAA